MRRAGAARVRAREVFSTFPSNWISTPRYWNRGQRVSTILEWNSNLVDEALFRAHAAAAPALPFELLAVSDRLDKWLWHARFYKTRSLATDAVTAARSRCRRTRQARSPVRVGDRLTLTIGQQTLDDRCAGHSRPPRSGQRSPGLLRADPGEPAAQCRPAGTAPAGGAEPAAPAIPVPTSASGGNWTNCGATRA